MSTGFMFIDDTPQGEPRPRTKAKSGHGVSAKTVIRLWAACLIAAPLLIALQWQLAYLLYAAILTVASISLGSAKGRPVGQLPLLFVIQWALIVIVAVAHRQDQDTLINLGSIAFGTISISSMLLLIPRESSALVWTLRCFKYACVAMIVLGVALGPLWAQLFGFTDPIADTLAGGRARIFSGDVGHSPLLDAGLIFSLLALSNAEGFRFAKRIAWFAFGAILVYLAKSSLGYIVLAGFLYVYAIESAPLAMLPRNILHVLIGSLALVILPSNGAYILESLRDFQTGGNIKEVYRSGDLSAGREQLNIQLKEAADDQPLFGQGVNDQILREGVTGEHGKKQAQSESGLRLAAKFGWPYFTLIFTICLSPLTVLLTNRRKPRILGACLAVYCTTVFLLNSLFELAHTWSTFALLPIVVLVSGYGWQNRKRALDLLQRAPTPTKAR